MKEKSSLETQQNNFHRATMSHSTRIISAFLLIFSLNLPSNVLSITYPNPWICEDCQETDITFYLPVLETIRLKYTGNAVEAFFPFDTNTTITGGIFGKTLYQIHKLSYYWKTDYLTYIFTLQANVIYFNTKYKSYENALNYPDGIAQITIPVFANGLVDNPSFNKFEQAFDQVKSNPGKITSILNRDLVSWIQKSPVWLTYAYYKSFYFDQDTEKSYPCATTVNMPPIPLQHYISCRQFLSTFGSLVDSSRKPLQNSPPLTFPTSLVGLGWGVTVLLIGAENYIPI